MTVLALSSPEQDHVGIHITVGLSYLTFSLLQSAFRLNMSHGFGQTKLRSACVKPNVQGHHPVTPTESLTVPVSLCVNLCTVHCSV